MSFPPFPAFLPSWLPQTVFLEADSSVVSTPYIEAKQALDGAGAHPGRRAGRHSSLPVCSRRERGLRQSEAGVRVGASFAPLIQAGDRSNHGPVVFRV